MALPSVDFLKPARSAAATDDFFDMKAILFLISFFVAASLIAADPRLRPETWGRPVVSDRLDNWYQLDEKIYRASQPSRRGFEDAVKFGIKNVLNLRDNHSDNFEAKGLKIKLYRVEMEADDVIEADWVTALKIIKNADGPILIHCWHGSDWTGLLCAMYRITFQNWSKEDAIDELINGGYDFHKMYDNLPGWIANVDVAKFKGKIFAP